MVKYINLIIGEFYLILVLFILMFAMVGFQIESQIMIFVIIGIFLLTIFLKKIKFGKINSKHLIIIIIGMSIVARMIPALFAWNYTCINDLSDTGVHYYGAQELAKGFLEEKIVVYEKIYPFLFPYTFFLSLWVRAFNGYIKMAILLSNIILDYSSVFLIYAILKKWKGKKSARIGMILSLINPFSIIACWCPLNLLLVNFFLLLAIYICTKIIPCHNEKKTIIFCGVLGIITCFANYFRPLFPVLIIAMIIILILKYFKYNSKIHLICILIMVITFLAPSFIINNRINSYLGEGVMNNTGGWNFYVGSNYDSKGQWTSNDRDFFFGELTPYYEVDVARSMIMKKGVERYSKYSVVMFIEHISNKMSVLFSNEGNAIYDVQYCLGINGDSLLYKVCTNMISVYFALLALLNFCNALKKNEFDANRLLLELLLLGFTASFLLVEVMNRYTFIMYPIMILISSITINEFIAFRKYKRIYNKNQ